VSNYLITEACHYACINGPGANVVMSFYKTDSATGLPIHYLKDSKEALWERFYEEYPDGAKRTTFYKYLEGELDEKGA
ncbi:20581_t:CDS:2, partial [Racocetra persica]